LIYGLNHIGKTEVSLDKYRLTKDVRPIEHVVYIPRAMVITTLPYTRCEGAEFIRHNGHHRLSVLASESVGIPYGIIPRLLLIWITTEAKIHKSKDIELGSSFKDFMSKLNMGCTGGKNGTIRSVRKQLRSLFQCSVSSSIMVDEHQDLEHGMRLADYSHFWWQPNSIIGNKTGYIMLSERFYNEIAYSAIPIDLRAVRALQQSPMALDIYMWLSWRVFALKRPCVIPWSELQKQFGANYTKLWHFENAFTKHLVSVKMVYPQLLAHAVKGNGLMLQPCPPHVLPIVDKPVN
jgi:hypothetical protein